MCVDGSGGNLIKISKQFYARLRKRIWPKSKPTRFPHSSENVGPIIGTLLDFSVHWASDVSVYCMIMKNNMSAQQQDLTGSNLPQYHHVFPCPLGITLKERLCIMPHSPTYQIRSQQALDVTESRSWSLFLLLQFLHSLWKHKRHPTHSHISYPGVCDLELS